MQVQPVPRGQFILEQFFERRFLYPFNAVFFAIAIVSIVRTDWTMLGICLIACFLNGLIATRLPKNQTKSFPQLARGSAGEIEPPADDAYPQMPVDRYPATNALTKCSYVAVATAAAIGYHLDQSQWIIAAAMTASYIGVMLLGTFVIVRSGVEYGACGE
jgi:hypothetical protein